MTDRTEAPWYRQVSASQWKTFLTTFTAWTLDAFDFTILTFVLIDIQQSFSVNRALAGALGTVTLLFRTVGGIGAGTLADRYGRKGPILFSIAWYTVFAFLSGLSTSYVMLFAFRGLFGIGMGGMWAAGMPLALEQWPASSRHYSGSCRQYSTGFLLSSLVYQLGYPLISDRPEWAWRLMLWAGVIPGTVIFFLMRRVPESPVWLEKQRELMATGARPRLSIGRLFDADLRWVTLHTSVLMGGFTLMYQSTTFWYPTLLTQLKQQPLAFLLLLNAGGLIGSVTLGALSERWGGRRGAATLGVVLGLASAPLFLFSATTSGLLAGAWLIGFMASGAWGIVPGYLSERFPTDARGVGLYHVGAGIGAGYLPDGGLQDLAA
jgi:SHS family lactate transporter-like MFS transporter